MKTQLTKNFTPKNIFFWIINILIFLILNSSTIIGVIMLFFDTNIKDMKLTEFDSNSFITKGNELFDKVNGIIGNKTNTYFDKMSYLQFFLEKSGWPKELFCMAFFSLLGFIFTCFYVKFLTKIIIRKLDIKKDNLSQDKELEIKKEALKMEKEKQELDILKIKAEAGLLTEKEIKKLEDRLC